MTKSSILGTVLLTIALAQQCGAFEVNYGLLPAAALNTVSAGMMSKFVAELSDCKKYLYDQVAAQKADKQNPYGGEQHDDNMTKSKADTYYGFFVFFLIVNWGKAIVTWAASFGDESLSKRVALLFSTAGFVLYDIPNVIMTITLASCLNARPSTSLVISLVHTFGTRWSTVAYTWYSREKNDGCLTCFTFIFIPVTTCILGGIVLFAATCDEDTLDFSGGSFEDVCSNDKDEEFKPNMTSYGYGPGSGGGDKEGTYGSYGAWDNDDDDMMGGSLWSLRGVAQYLMSNNTRVGTAEWA